MTTGYTLKQIENITGLNRRTITRYSKRWGVKPKIGNSRAHLFNGDFLRRLLEVQTTKNNLGDYQERMVHLEGEVKDLSIWKKQASGIIKQIYERLRVLEGR